AAGIRGGAPLPQHPSLFSGSFQKDTGMNAPKEASGLAPLVIMMHPDDNVAVAGRDGGLPPGPEGRDGNVGAEALAPGPKVALGNLAKGDAIRRYNVTIGYALEDIAAGRWVNERSMGMPAARELDDKLPMATRKAPRGQPLEGYTFEGYRNADGSVGTRNI